MSKRACTSLWDFLVTSCPLSWYGITIYALNHATRVMFRGPQKLNSKISNVG
jgi:hypothetical protein